ncbi:hypothetical protein TRVA0_035S01024 [Trichomonascus vanleenenianus]|uniref:uncharacterized protein n=1 Tax=Trichomonascus vanleenenianus TaxID=2268995 RepID=UPI003ECB149A
MIDWTGLLGGEKDLVLAKVGLGQADNVKKYSDVTYYCYNSKGLALSFDQSDRLEGVEWYNKNKAYSQVDPEYLMEPVTREFTGKDFVTVYGEPSDKGGAKAIEIWLRWETALGLQVDLASRNWDDGQNSIWASMSLYRI